MIRSRTRIAAAAALFGLFLMVASCIAGYHMLTVMQNQLREKQQQAAYLRARENGVSLLERKLADTKRERDALYGLMLPQGGAIEFLTLIETLGLESGTDVATASIDLAEELPAFDMLKIDIKASGSLEGVLQVLRLLETLPYASSVTSASLAAQDREAAEWEGNFTLLIAKHKEI